MALLTDLLGNILFPGVPSNAVYDLIKVVWNKATNKAWEDLYLDAFQQALNQSKPYLKKYSGEGDDITLDRDALSNILHWDLGAAVDTWSYSQLSTDEFITKLARAMEAHQVLVLPGRELSETDYSQLIHNLVRLARALFKEAILNNEQAFRQALLDEALLDQARVQQLQDYLISQFGPSVLEKLKALEGKIDDVTVGIRHIEQILTSLRYFRTLEEYLLEPGPRFPKLHDFEEDLIYLPEKYVLEIQGYLKEKRRALVVGRSAAGKTVLAIALAKHLQETAGYTIFYGDVALAEQGDGRKWYQVIRANDRKNVLYILDNCHLAPREVSEFCFQWDGQPPKDAQCILISRPEIDEAAESFTEIEDYFDRCTDVVVAVQSEEIYYSVLEKYANAYQQQDSNRYVALENDRASFLEEQHAHNLVASRTRLETWRKIGGRLSEVKQEEVYKVLEKRYLSKAKKALPALCVLRQYEIPVHYIFVEEILDQVEVQCLKEQRLLTYSLVQGYGVLYELLLHPREAQEIFQASIYRQRGHINDTIVNAEIIRGLHAYIKSKPRNYVSVYKGLKTQQEKAILHTLLTDRDLQACVVAQPEMESILDTALYLYYLSSVDFSRAQELLRTCVQKLEIKGICSRLVEYPLHDIGLSLWYIQKLDVEVGRELVAEIGIKQLVQRAETANNLQSLYSLVRALKSVSPTQAKIFLESISVESIPVQTLVAQANSSSFNSIRRIVEHLQELGYPPAQLKAFVEAIDMKQLAQRAETVNNLHNLYWLVRTFRNISSTQVKIFLESIPVQTLATKANSSSFSSVRGVVKYLQELGYPPAQLKAFVEAIDMKQLAQRAEIENLQGLYWLMRALKNVSPAVSNRLLEAITPGRLAFLFRSRKVTFQIFHKISRISTKSFWEQFLKELSTDEIVDILSRTTLDEFAIILKQKYDYYRHIYDLFRYHLLVNKLNTASLLEIGKYIYHIYQVRGEGPYLAHEALDLLLAMDLSERIASTDLEQLSHLLNNTKVVDEAYSSQLLLPLDRPEIIQAALEKSGVRGIALLIHDIANIDGHYLQDIEQALQTLDLTDKLAMADVKDIGYFLWNVYVYSDRGLAQKYCRLVDMQQRSSHLRKASLDDLCSFLWKLAQISDLQNLQTLDDPIVTERLLAAWHREIGLCAQLLGIIAIARPPNTKVVSLPPIETEVQKEHLASWLAKFTQEQHPYALALALYGLRAFDELEARAIVQKWLSIPEASRLLEAAKVSAVTPLSAVLLEEILEWLANLPTPFATKRKSAN